MTPELFAKACGVSAAVAEQWAKPVAAAMTEFGIDTPIRQAAFLSQIGHESGGFVHVRELWGPTPEQRRYEGRADLGNTQAGDGIRYRGRGLIQITGRSNYRQVGEALGFNLEASPHLLETTALAARSAAWFWKSRKLNALADRGDVIGVTQRINGGLNGLEDRMRRYERALPAMKFGS